MSMSEADLNRFNADILEAVPVEQAGEERAQTTELRDHVQEMREIQEQTEEIIAQAEEAEEQPVAVVQEFFEPDDQPITEPQAVADVLSAGEVYPNLPPTLEDFRALVKALETPNGDVYHQVDLNMIPESVTPQDFVNRYMQMGGMLPSGTRFVYGTDPITETPQVVPVVEEVKEEKLPFPEETEEQAQARHDADQKRYEEERVKAKKEMDDRRLKVKRKKLREGIHVHSQYFIKEDEIMFFLTNDGHIGSARFDTTEGNLETIGTRRTMEDEYTGDSRRLLTSSITFDKNMNGLIPDYSHFDETPNVNVNVIDPRTSFMGGVYTHPGSSSWITIDKLAFLSSGGKEFKLKTRVGYSYQEVLMLKRKIASEIKESEDFIFHLKKTIGEMYDEDNFEILYDHTFNMEDSSYFEIFLQFPNLTITNSIEMTHNIDNLIVKMKGQHYYGVGMEKNTMLIERNIDGLRTTFTPEDAYHGYCHSHLPGESAEFEDFCMGSEHFMTHTSSGISSYTTDIEFELMLIAVFDHISWESLEGGPYRKMEEIGEGRGSEIKAEEKLVLPAIYTKSDLRVILDHLHSQDMSSLFKAFELRLQSNGEVGYDYNKLIFIQELNILMEDVMEDMYDENGTNLYAYIPSADKFIQKGDGETTPKNWDNVVERAEEKMEHRPIVYINGDYVLPEIVKKDGPTKPMVYTIPSLHPTFVLYIANIIKYHLLNEMKYVK